MAFARKLYLYALLGSGVSDKTIFEHDTLSRPGHTVTYEDSSDIVFDGTPALGCVGGILKLPPLLAFPRDIEHVYSILHSWGDTSFGYLSPVQAAVSDALNNLKQL